MKLQRGSRLRLDTQLSTALPLTIRVTADGNADYDFTCFGLDGDGKLSDDRYMIFYNQTASPERAVTMTQSGGATVFTTALAQLPQKIQKLAFTVSIDGMSTMAGLRQCTVSLTQDGKEPLELSLTGNDFHAERAIIAIELYRKDDWRLAAVAAGFNGGLPDLLKSYGGVEADAPAQPKPTPTPAPIPQPAPKPQAYEMPPVIVPPVLAEMDAPKPAAPTGNPGGKISLEKKLAAAPKLVNLAKPIQVVLEKKKLSDTTARVALVLDISGSMMQRYRNGTVQTIVDKILPLAVQFDNDGALDFWYYGSEPKRMPAVTMQNYTSAVPREFERLMFDLGYGNEEPKVMRLVTEEYRDSKLPAYVIFITDGDVGNEKAIRKLITDAATLPIFWQFVGVGGKNYGILQRLDALAGRYVDNAGFFALDDFMRVPNDTLYSRLLSEFPRWLEDIRAKGMLSAGAMR